MVQEWQRIVSTILSWQEFQQNKHPFFLRALQPCCIWHQQTSNSWNIQIHMSFLVTVSTSLLSLMITYTRTQLRVYKELTSLNFHAILALRGAHNVSEFNDILNPISQSRSLHQYITSQLTFHIQLPSLASSLYLLHPLQEEKSSDMFFFFSKFST